MRPLTLVALGIAVVCSGCATGLTGTPNWVSKTGATIGGRVVSDTGGQVEYWVQYGPTTAYGSETAHGTVTATQNEVVAVAVDIQGLAPATLYHYRLCARDSQQQGGPGCGEDRRLTTQTVGCGDTVTSDVKLTGNLLCPQEAGLIVGAAGVDINLGGHTMDGDIRIGGGGPRGVDNSGGYDDLTVRNGGLVAFGFGVFVSGADRNQIVHVLATGAGNGITIEGGTGNEIRRGSAFGRSVGISVVASDRVLVANTHAEGGFGAALEVSGNVARLVGNEIVHSGSPLGSRPGLALIGSAGRIADNRVTGAWVGAGIFVAGSDNAILDNEVSGAVLPGMGPPVDSFGDGIFVSAFSTGTVLRRNYVHENEDDGIQTRDPTSRLGDNIANENGDFGIEAVAGVTDLGGNRASGNGSPIQCRNVFCQ